MPAAQPDDNVNLGMSLLSGMLRSTHDHIAIKDLEGRYVIVNPAAVEWFGLPAQSVVGRTNAEIFGKAVAAATARRDRPLYELGEAVSYEEFLTRDGVTRTWLTTKDAIRDRAGRVIAYSSISREITQRVLAEAALERTDDALRQSVGLLNGIVDGATDHISVKDLEGRYLLVNRACAGWFGIPAAEIVGRTDIQLIGAVEGAEVMALDREVIASGTPCHYEQVVPASDGALTWLTTKDVIRDADGRAIAVFAISREVSDQKRVEAQLRQSAKMEAVGQLAGGVAHDFNNMLTAIRGFTELVRGHLPADQEEDRADLDQVLLAADRASALTRQLLAFSSKQVLAPQVLDPVETLAAIIPMVRRLLGEHVELALQSQPGTGLVLVDPAQLEQVVVNLAVNARDAMPDGGTLTITTADLDVGETDTKVHAWMTPGPYVELAVADTGTGMAAGIRDRIFEPFFTTKGPGKGTGLGLSMVQGVVRQSGGHILVESEPGVGTTFRIRLPRQPGLRPTSPHAPVTLRDPGGHELILLVEDEPGVRELAGRALRLAGYTVLAAADPAAASVIIAGGGAQIDLLLTDVVMPGGMGPDVARAFEQVNGRGAVLYMSGYPGDAINPRGLLDPGILMLAKPFSTGELLAAVRSAIGTIRG